MRDGLLDRIFGGNKVKEVIEVVGDKLDDLFTSKEEKAKALLAIEQEFNRHLEVVQQNTLKEFELVVADRDSARKMQADALHQDDKFSKRFIYYLASFLLITATAFGVMLCFVQIPDDNKRLVEMFADFFFISSVGSVIGFFFGSSKSSHDKNSIIERINK